MNKPFLLLLCICSFHVFLAQKRSAAELFYDKGNAAVSRKDYRTADSLFTLSLNLEPHPDGYYNRAVCKRQLKDFKGYCLDMLSASKLGDKEATKIYWKQCATADTIYKNNNGEIAPEYAFETVEYITSYKYNTNFEYEKRDSSKHIILSKIRVDNVVIYRACSEVTPPAYPGGVDSLIKKIKTETEFSKQVQKNDLAGMARISVLFDELGKITDAKIIYGKKNAAIDDVLKIILNSTNWTSGIYNTRAIKFQAEFVISYYDAELLITSRIFKEKGTKEVYDPVEVMPEYQGGVREFMMYLGRNTKYPQRAKEAGLMGRCYLKFVVLQNGKITNVELLSGVPGCRECDIEALRVIRTMPKWKPGSQNGIPVPVEINMPFNFTLK